MMSQLRRFRKYRGSVTGRVGWREKVSARFVRGDPAVIGCVCSANVVVYLYGGDLLPMNLRLSLDRPTVFRLARQYISPYNLQVSFLLLLSTHPCVNVQA